MNRYAEEKVSDGTWTVNSRISKISVLKMFGEDLGFKNLPDIATQEVQTWYDDQKKRVPDSAHGYMTTVRAFFEWAAGKKMLRTSPAAGVKMGKANKNTYSIVPGGMPALSWRCLGRGRSRFTEKLVFNRLSYDNQLETAGLLLTNELKFLRDKGRELASHESVLPFLVRRGFHPKLVARPMRDTIEKLVGDAVSTDLLTGGTACGQLLVEENGCFLSIRK